MIHYLFRGRRIKTAVRESHELDIVVRKSLSGIKTLKNESVDGENGLKTENRLSNRRSPST